MYLHVVLCSCETINTGDRVKTTDGRLATATAEMRVNLGRAIWEVQYDDGQRGYFTPSEVTFVNAQVCLLVDQDTQNGRFSPNE